MPHLVYDLCHAHLNPFVVGHIARQQGNACAMQRNCLGSLLQLFLIAGDQDEISTQASQMLGNGFGVCDVHSAPLFLSGRDV